MHAACLSDTVLWIDDRKIGTMTLIRISRCILSAREDGQSGRHRSSIYLNLSLRETIEIL